MVDFSDPTTWDQPLTDENALSLGIFALNTLAHPEGSSDAQMDALDFFTEGATERLVEIRVRLDRRQRVLLAHRGRAVSLAERLVDEGNDVRTTDHHPTATEFCSCHWTIPEPVPQMPDGSGDTEAFDRLSAIHRMDQFLEGPTT